MKSVELFAGAGGLAIGMSNAGFHHAAVIEWDHDSCETFRENQRLHMHSIEEWPLHEGDVRGFKYDALRDVMVVSGGPPCQPFSLGGKHRGYNDERDMFPEAVRAVRELQPKAFIFENVKGLLRETFSDYFEYINLPANSSQPCSSTIRDVERTQNTLGIAPYIAENTFGIQRGVPTSQCRRLWRPAKTRACFPGRFPL